MQTAIRFFSLLLGAWIALAGPASAADPPSTRGQDLYETNCASCHGYEGKGNGPMATMFSPKPADLTAKTLKHGSSDADLFKTISGGVGGTAMQAWKPKLSDADIQAVIKYVRDLRKSR